MVWNKQESRRRYWATRSSVRSWESEVLMSQNDLVLSHSAASPTFLNSLLENGKYEFPTRTRICMSVRTSVSPFVKQSDGSLVHPSVTNAQVQTFEIKTANTQMLGWFMSGQEIFRANFFTLF